MQISASARSICDRQISIKPCSAPHFHRKCGALFVGKNPLSFAALSRFPLLSLRDIFPRPGEVSPQGDANPLRRFRASSPVGRAFCYLPVSSNKAPPRGSRRAAARLRGFVLRQTSSPSPSLLRKSTLPLLSPKVTSSPGAGEVFPQRERLWRNHKLCT